MPGVTLHLVLVHRVLEHWMDAPGDAPFDPHTPVFTNAFYQGAFGPDLGYFPGGTRLLSELSHLVGSGDLTRTLVWGARTPLERAFSWGWATHVLADRCIHPLIGRAVGELVYGNRSVLADAAQHQIPHIQVETGLDAFYSHLFPDLRKRKMTSVFDGDSIRFLTEAYRKVYSLRLDPSVFLASHLATARMSVQGLITIGALSTALIHKPVPPAVAGTRWFLQGALALMKAGLARDSLLKALLNPIPPTEWLLEKVERRVGRFADRFLRLYRSNLRDLPNYNLDTGRVQDRPPTHPGTLWALKTLARKGGRVPSEPEKTSPVGAVSGPLPSGAHV